MMTQSFEQVLNESGSLLYKNVGISMLPLIREGQDYIYIKKRPPERLKKNDVVLFSRPHVQGRGRYVLHRIRKVNKDGTYWIVGDNCINGETVKEENILGVLSAVKRNGKTVNMTDSGYRLYVALVPLRRLLRVLVRPVRAILRKLYHMIKR